MEKNNFELLIFLLAITVVSAFLTLWFLKNKRKKKQDEIITFAKQKNSFSLLGMAYQFYKNFPLLRSYFLRIRSKVKIQYPADTYEINKRTTKIFTQAVGTAIFYTLFAMMFANGNIYNILGGLCLVYVVFSKIIQMKVYDMENIILNQFAQSLTTIRHYYHDTGIVETSLSLSMNELPYAITLHLDKIYNAITSVNMNYAMEKYIGTEPNKLTLMLLSLCASVKTYGDTKLGENKTSLFLTDLNFLKEEANEEVLSRNANQAAFAMTDWLTLIPLLVLGPMQMLLGNSLPELKKHFNGLYGNVTTVVIFATSIICHSLICYLRDGSIEVEKENNLAARVAEMPFFKKWLTKIVNKRYTEYQRYDNDMRGIGDHTGPKAFLLKRLVYAVATAAIILVLFVSGEVTQKYGYMRDFADAYTNSVVPNEETREKMRYCSREYIKFQKKAKLNRNELADKIKDEGKVRNRNQAEAVADEIISRLDKYNNTYFKWYYLVIMLVGGYVAYMAPVWYLRFKKEIIGFRKEEEVMQFQSLMLILMHINGVTVEVILEWMERFSYCFRQSITECRLTLNNGTKKALQEMKDKENFLPFQNFVDNLIAIDRVGVRDAFDEIQTDRDYYKSKRKQDREQTIQKKSKIAGRLIFVPLFAMIFLGLLGPLLLYTASLLKGMSVFLT